MHSAVVHRVVRALNVTLTVASIVLDATQAAGGVLTGDCSLEAFCDES